MYRLFFVILVTFFSPRLSLAEDLILAIDNIQVLEGALMWSVYNDEKGFDSDGLPLVAGRSRVIAGKIKVTLHDLPAGDYAIKLFHDENDNGELDSNLLGLPQEGYGFSNNAGAFGPASFADAKVAVTGTTEINISLR